MGFIIAYNTVFDLSVWHDHFLAPGPVDTFTPPPAPADFELLLPYRTDDFIHWELSGETAQVVANKGLIFKQNRYGCLVAKKALFSETDPSVKITLLAKLRDPNFLNYTNMGFNFTHPKQGNIIYLYNKGLTGPGRINLSRSAGNFLQLTNNQYPWQTRIVRLNQLSPGTTANVDIFDATSAAVTPIATLEANGGDTGYPEYELDCRFLPSGLYRFESSNLATTTLYIGQENSSSDVLAVVDIYLAGISAAHYDIRFDHF